MKVLKWLDESFEEIILVVLLVVIAVVMGIQICARVFANALTWSEEMARFCFVWSGFLSISYSIKKQISIKIEQVVDMVPVKVKLLFKVVEKVLMLAFYGYMIQFAYDYTIRGIASGQLSPAMQLPMWIIQLAPLTGFILTVIRLVQSLIQTIMALTKSGEPA